jgi:hypothetical protein
MQVKFVASLYFRCSIAYDDVPGFGCVCPEIDLEEVSRKLSSPDGLSISLVLNYGSAVVDFPVSYSLFGWICCTSMMGLQYCSISFG